MLRRLNAGRKCYQKNYFKKVCAARVVFQIQTPHTHLYEHIKQDIQSVSSRKSKQEPFEISSNRMTHTLRVKTNIPKSIPRNFVNLNS